jgi:hypothetical protein
MHAFVLEDLIGKPVVREGDHRFKGRKKWV